MAIVTVRSHSGKIKWSTRRKNWNLFCRKTSNLYLENKEKRENSKNKSHLTFFSILQVQISIFLKNRF